MPMIALLKGKGTKRCKINTFPTYSTTMRGKLKYYHGTFLILQTTAPFELFGAVHENLLTARMWILGKYINLAGFPLKHSQKLSKVRSDPIKIKNMRNRSCSSLGSLRSKDLGSR